MGLFDFARDAGENVREALGGKKDLDAQELVKAIRDKGVTLDNGRVTVQGDTVIVTGEASNAQEHELAVLILGNTKGVAKVDDRITVRAPAPGAKPAPAQAQGQAAPAAAPQPAFYVVKAGDTLSGIAKQLYGDANRYHEIFEANRPMLSDPDKIYPGQTLRVPGATRH